METDTLTHILDTLASSKSYKEDTLKIDGFRVFQRGKSNPKSRAPHKNQTLILCDRTLNVLAQAQPRNTGCLWKQRARQNSSFSGQKGMRILLPIHFRLVDIGQEYLSPVLETHEEPNSQSLHRSFYKTLPYQIIW